VENVSADLSSGGAFDFVGKTGKIEKTSISFLQGDVD
jgi:hypothetical protein